MNIWFLKSFLKLIKRLMENSSEWQLTFEDETIDPVVHAYMTAWELKYTALTH